MDMVTKIMKNKRLKKGLIAMVSGLMLLSVISSSSVVIKEKLFTEGQATSKLKTYINGKSYATDSVLVGKTWYIPADAVVQAQGGKKAQGKNSYVMTLKNKTKVTVYFNKTTAKVGTKTVNTKAKVLLRSKKVFVPVAFAKTNLNVTVSQGKKTLMIREKPKTVKPSSTSSTTSTTTKISTTNKSSVIDMKKVKDTLRTVYYQTSYGAPVKWDIDFGYLSVAGTPALLYWEPASRYNFEMKVVITHWSHAYGEEHDPVTHYDKTTTFTELKRLLTTALPDGSGLYIANLLNDGFSGKWSNAKEKSYQFFSYKDRQYSILQRDGAVDVFIGKKGKNYGSLNKLAPTQYRS